MNTNFFDIHKDEITAFNRGEIITYIDFWVHMLKMVA